MRIFENKDGLTIDSVEKVNSLDTRGLLYVIAYDGVETDHINFQIDPIEAVGVNGLTDEAMLAIYTHRVESMITKDLHGDLIRAHGLLKQVGSLLASYHFSKALTEPA